MTDVIASGAAAMGDGTTRKEKRRAMKKVKRKQTRKEAAVREREEEEARQNDPHEQLRIRIKEQEEAEAAEMERKAFEERERLWLEAAAARKAAEEAEAAEAEERKKLLLEEEKKHKEQTGDFEENDDWEYVEEGPAEIIWQGNEIIVKKKRVKIPKEGAKGKPVLEDSDRPTSNPLPPQSSAFASYMNEPSNSAQEALEKVAQQVPNFGTEQDKAHCPFHLKTGACRFGSRCSRIHFHPDKSCTLLIKNMYNGPGLAWEQDEGLEYTDEEVERAYEEFYEDVHTEFLKYGELVNFKVCRNGSYHLRGNVYVHYKSLDSAVLAYTSTNGRYYAGKQITCEFISVTKWKVAICGDFMKSRFKTCSHGSACNFIHCFRNPGGDYEWADWDNPPPKHWTKKMIALFGPSNESDYDRLPVEGSERSDRKRTMASNRFHSRLENETDSYSRRSRGEDSHVQDNHFSYHSNRKSKEVPSEQSDRKSNFKDNLKIKDSTYDSHSENENKSDKYQKHKGRHRSEDDSFKGKREKQPYSKKYMKDDQYERYSNQHEQESRELYRHSGSYEEPHRENEENKSDKLRRHKGRHRSGEYSYKRKREEPYSNYSMKYIEDDQYEPRYNGQHGQESREPSRHSSSDDESDRKNEENKSDKFQKHKGRHKSGEYSYERKREEPYSNYSKKYIEDDQYEPRYSGQHGQESREPSRHSSSDDESDRKNEENKSNKLRKHKGRHRSGEYSYKRKREEPYSNYSKKYIEDDQYEPRYSDQHGQESREPSRHSSSDGNREEPYSNYSKKYIEDDTYEPRYSDQHGQESQEPSRHSSSDGNRE